MRLPTLARLLSEDFADQSKWIDRLLTPLNQYFGYLTQALSRGLTIGDNMNAAIKTFEVDGNWPIKLAWELSARPVTAIVGQVVRSDGNDLSTFSITGSTTNTSTSVTSLSSTAGLHVGQPITGTGIPAGTQIATLDTSASSLTLSKAATATNAGTTLTLTLDQAVGVRWQYNQANQLQIDGVTGIGPSASNKYKITLVCFTG